MLRHDAVTAFRRLLRRPAYSAINVAGLSIGLSACLLIALHVHDERSYDRFHANAERTYRVLREFDTASLRAAIETTPSALAAALDGVPGVEKAVRVLAVDGARVRRDATEIVEPGLVLADDGFFDVFSFDVVRGEARLDRPGTLLLTRDAAARYFPAGADPLGSVLEVEGIDMEVTGLLADVPTTSHLRFDFVASMPDEASPRDGREWSINNFTTYVLLETGADADRVAAEIARAIDASNTAPSADGNNFVPHLQPLTGIRFGTGVAVDIDAAGSALYAALFAALAALILLAACVNFTNLATARASERAREIGVRKSLGAARRRLAVEFLAESLLASALSLGPALVLCRLALPCFNALAGKSLSLAPLASAPGALALAALVALVGFVAGLYPALVMSGFPIANVLKGGPIRTPAGGKRFRRALVVFQLAVSIALIAATAVVLEQFRYLRGAGLGFEPQDVLVVRQLDHLDERADVFRQEVARLPSVRGTTAAFSLPGTLFLNSIWRPSTPGAAQQNLNYSLVDPGYVETLGIELAAGRAPSPLLADDAKAVLLNESAARRFGWSPADAIGRALVAPWGGDPHTVVGVAKDFNYRSLHSAVYPVVLAMSSGVPPYARNAARYLAVRVAPDRHAATAEEIEALWQRFSNLPFQFSWLEDDLDAQYGAEQRLAGIFAAFAGVAVAIACLGLLGLAAFDADRRRKEIGVRKVLGATRRGVVALVTREHLVHVAIAFGLSTPVAYWAMRRWLDGFAYRVELGAAPFVIAGALGTAATLLAVCTQVLRASAAHPADSLRHE